MSKSVFLVVLLSTFSAACGASHPGHASILSPEIQLQRSRTFESVMTAALDAHESELEAAASQHYASRREALDKARDLGSENRLLFHIRTALEAEGLTVDDLCRFSSDNPGYADHQRERYIERSERFESLVEAVAAAPVDAGTLADAMESGDGLTSSSGKAE